MKHTSWLLAALLSVVASDAVPHAHASAMVADSEGKRVFVAEATGNAVAMFDVDAGKVALRYEVDGPIGGVALSPDGNQLYVTRASAEGVVHVIDTSNGRVRRTIEVGHTPTAVVVSPDGRMVYVCNRFNNNVLLIDAGRLEVTAEVPARREPVAAATTPDGKLLVVANLLPVGRSDADDVAAEVSVVDTVARSTRSVRLPNGSSSVRGVCVSPEGTFAYVTHILSRYTLPTTQLERGWVNTNALSVIDLQTGLLFNTVLLDEIDHGAANPWGVACSRDGNHLVVAHAGTHEISIIDRPALHDRLTRVASGEPVTEVSTAARHVQDDLAFLAGLRRRVDVKGIGPRSLAILGEHVCVGSYFSDSIELVPLSSGPETECRSYALTPERPMSQVRRGEMLFHDARMCFQQWQSCSSCHPGEGRVDGLNWDLLNDGIGNAKNTRSVLLAFETPPAMSVGVRESAAAAVRSGIKHIQLAVRPETDAAAIDAYLKSLQLVPSPHLINGLCGPAAARGREVFDKAGCAECHPPPLYTDLNAYDVGTGRGQEKDRPFDTPTLIELWRTAPYLHDGRAETLKQVLIEYNPDDRHGRTSDLSDAQIRDLIAFLLSQ